ncbi:MAG: 30S ribosomal protein S3 [Candidatus Nanoarchaeia archaeon]
MIEREFIKEKAKYLKIKEYVMRQIPKIAGIGKISIERTPLGEKIIVNVVKPGLIIGRGGKTIADLTTTLKTKFGLENPQIEVREITNPSLNAAVVANRIASDLERFGAARFKAIGYKALTDIMNAGALGTEIKISGRGVPGARAKRWRFPAGYMKKSGQIALEEVDFAMVPANLHSGTVGVQVKIMPPAIHLPDRMKIKEVQVAAPAQPIAEVKVEEPVAPAEKPAEKKSKKTRALRKKKTEVIPAEAKQEEKKE